VNPNDPRYKHLVGKTAILPGAGRRLPIIADEHADPDKGTGAVKITPAHDFDDYEVGKRHGIKPINIFTPDAKIDISELKDPNDYVRSFAGMDRFEAREAMLVKLKETGALVKTEKIRHKVPRSDRGNTIVEPRLTEQWYCDVSKLALKAIERTKTGELKFFPKHWENTWYAWLNNIQPWCISRQIWWGHRIPAYYDKDGKLAYVGFEPPAGLTQDGDTLDTWFSSGLWPMATLGWPDEESPDFKRFFPGSALITGFDIIFFWVARMVMMSLHFTGKLPFESVVLRGLVTDQHGQKMSKTKGNVINPMELVDEYGIDAVRFAMCSLSTEGRFIPFGKGDVENSRRFLTKLLNAVQFWEMKGVKEAGEKYASEPLSDWILTRMNETVSGVKKSLDAYRYDEYAMGVYHFVWDDFCDRFIELAKKDMTSAMLSAARIALKNIILMLAPVVPFTCAELWERLRFGKAADIINAPFAEPVKVKTPADIAKKWLDDLLLKEKVAAEKASAKTELEQLEKRIASLEAQLANETFVKNAKPEVVSERRQSLADAQSRRAYLKGL
jgi:valyl-tRNA synthetase